MVKLLYKVETLEFEKYSVKQEWEHVLTWERSPPFSSASLTSSIDSKFAVHLFRFCVVLTDASSTPATPNKLIWPVSAGRCPCLPGGG